MFSHLSGSLVEVGDSLGNGLQSARTLAKLTRGTERGPDGNTREAFQECNRDQKVLTRLGYVAGLWVAMVFSQAFYQRVCLGYFEAHAALKRLNGNITHVLTVLPLIITFLGLVIFGLFEVLILWWSVSTEFLPAAHQRCVRRCPGQEGAHVQGPPGSRPSRQDGEAGQKGGERVCETRRVLSI